MSLFFTEEIGPVCLRKPRQTEASLLSGLFALETSKVNCQWYNGGLSMYNLGIFIYFLASAMANSSSVDSSLLWIPALALSVAFLASPIPPHNSLCGVSSVWGQCSASGSLCDPASSPSCLLLSARQHALSRGFVAFTCSFHTALWRAWEKGRDRKGGGRWGKRDYLWSIMNSSGRQLVELGSEW